MKRKTYPAKFKEQALRKARERGVQTHPNIADELNNKVISRAAMLEETINTSRGW